MKTVHFTKNSKHKNGKRRKPPMAAAVLSMNHGEVLDAMKNKMIISGYMPMQFENVKKGKVTVGFKIQGNGTRIAEQLVIDEDEIHHYKQGKLYYRYTIPRFLSAYSLK